MPDTVGRFLVLEAEARLVVASGCADSNTAGFGHWCLLIGNGAGGLVIDGIGKYFANRGEMFWRGRKVNPKAIRKTSLFTVEGERDDICAVGQTLAAHDLASSLMPFRKKHHLQAGVGHYGVFSGKKWESQTYPLLRNMILQND